MNRVLSNILFAIVTVIFTANSVFSLESEYKNSLVKIEMNKTGESAYNINLYTQKKYTEPVRVIKKSDLNYYILLPETKNSSSSVGVNTADIRNVTTNSYKYAGADVNNGYTKINIDTTKPINFNLTVKNSTASLKSVLSPTSVASSQAPASNNTEVKPVEKKNTDFSKNNAQEKSVNQQKTAVSQKAPVPVKDAPKPSVAGNGAKSGIDKLQPKKEIVTAQKDQKDKKLSNEQSKEVQAVKTQAKTTAADKTVKKQQKQETMENLVAQEVQKAKQESSVAENPEPIKNDSEELAEEYQENEASIPEEGLTGEDEYTNEDNLQLSDALNLGVLKRIILNKFDGILSILDDYGIKSKDALLMILAGIFSFIFASCILSRKSSSNAKLKNKNELLENKEKQVVRKVQKKQQPQAQNNGQYFVFDETLEKKEPKKPQSEAEKRGYELSSYKPEENKEEENNAEKAPAKEDNRPIIKKAFDKEVFIDIPPKPSEEDNIEAKEAKEEAPEILSEEENVEEAPQEENKNTQESEVEAETKTKEEIESEAKTEAEVEPKAHEQKSDEPEVLSKVEIAPERGFMCISYEENISLIGYIFDDVFALYNFKCPKLENYDIRFRLSEKTDKDANFIVRVAHTKMLIKVTKKSMKLEVTL